MIAFNNFNNSWINLVTVICETPLVVSTFFTVDDRGIISLVFPIGTSGFNFQKFYNFIETDISHI